VRLTLYSVYHDVCFWFKASRAAFTVSAAVSRAVKSNRHFGNHESPLVCRRQKVD
jgi:hypothetical protein